MSKQQSLGSWLRSVGTITIACIPEILAAAEASKQPSGKKLKHFLRKEVVYYTGKWLDPDLRHVQSVDNSQMWIGYGSKAAAVGYNIGMGEMNKRAPIKSIFPKIR